MPRINPNDSLSWPIGETHRNGARTYTFPDIDLRTPYNGDVKLIHEIKGGIHKLTHLGHSSPWQDTDEFISYMVGERAFIANAKTDKLPECFEVLVPNELIIYDQHQT